MVAGLAAAEYEDDPNPEAPMSIRTVVLYVLTCSIATLALPAVASARPIDEFGPVAMPSAQHAASSGPSPLLFVAAALVVVLLIATVRIVSARRIPVKA